MWDKLVARATGADLYIIGIKFLLVVALLGGTYLKGRSDGTSSVLEERISELGKQAEENKKYFVDEMEKRNKLLNTRLEEVALDSRKAATFKQELNDIEENLNAAISKRPASANCAPTPSELSYYGELARRTRPASTGEGVQ